MGKLHPNQRKAIRRRLLAWFDAQCRDLPWRGTSDPYAIWISEVMLQQTQVVTVIDYYRRFLKRFPTVTTLAKSDVDAVLKLWEGLGYYSRARSLHKAAGVIVRDHNGRLPQTVDQLRMLPGIGPYTAGAIASMAYGAVEPVVDGNVIRVLCRLCRIEQSPRMPAVQRQLWALADELIPADRPGDFNQALMELGALLCRPADPACDECPLKTLCLARRNGLQHELPVRTPGKKTPHHTFVAAVISRSDGCILIDRRREAGLLGGLWEFPGGRAEPREALCAALLRHMRENVGLEIDIGKKLCTVKHAYSHFRITLHVFLARARQGRARPLACAAVKWVHPAALRQHAFSRANHVILEHLDLAHHQRSLCSLIAGSLEVMIISPGAAHPVPWLSRQYPRTEWSGDTARWF